MIQLISQSIPSGAAAISNALVSNNVLVQTTAEGATSSYGTTSSGAGDIVVAAPISWYTANSLTLSAYHDINVNASISLTNGTLISQLKMPSR